MLDQGTGSERPHRLLDVNHISKWYGATCALDAVTLQVASGEVLGVVGENGAGKSTLMRILAGVEKPDAGDLFFNEHSGYWNNPEEARRAGVSILYQEPKIYPKLTVLENLYAGSMVRSRWGLLDWPSMQKAAQVSVRAFGLDPAVIGQRMGSLSIGTQQMVLIARAVHTDCRLLILDEPTAILSHGESERLFQAIHMLRNKNPDIGIIYISHRLRELMGFVHRAVVLKDGRVAGLLSADELQEERIVELMTGRLEVNRFTKPHGKRDHPQDASADTSLTVDQLTCHPFYEKITFTLRSGKITCLYGLVGSGRSEVALTVFGALQAQSGMLRINDQKLVVKNPRQAIQQGIAYVPEDRNQQAIFPTLSILYNSISAAEPSLSVHGWVRPTMERQLAQNIQQRFHVKLSNLADSIMTLSGGNQQKIVLGRWMSTHPRILLLDEPTRGVDVEVKEEIHETIRSLAQQGLTILVVTSDLPEALNLADELLVMRQGHLEGRLVGDQMTEERVIRMALGYSAEAECHAVDH